MAKPIVIERDGKLSTLDLSKISRSKLYGSRRRVPLDPDDAICERASLTEDGSLLLRSGMTAQGYFDEQGAWIPNASLVGLDADRKPVEKQPSTLGVAQALEGPIDPAELLDCAITSVYALEPQELDAELDAALSAGKVFRFPFAFRAGWSAGQAFLVKGADGLFALIGDRVPLEWVDLDQPAPLAFEEEDDDFDDDLDFEMF